MALKQDTEEAQRSKDSEASHWDGSSNGTACCCCCCSSTCGASPPTPPTNSSSKCHGTVSSNAMADIRLGRGRGVLCSWLNAWRLGRWRGGDHCACARNNEMRMYVRHAYVRVGRSAMWRGTDKLDRHIDANSRSSPSLFMHLRWGIRFAVAKEQDL